MKKTQEYKSLGFDGIAYSLDVSVLTNAYKQIVDQFK